MSLSSLNADVLLQLMKRIDPVDRLNLLLSGILKGFENVDKGIDLRNRIEEFGIELGPCRYSTCQLEIRSLKNNKNFYHEQIPENLLTILKRLADGGFLKNNRQWIVSVGWLRDPWLFQVVRSMNNLEKLNLLGCNLTLKDVPQLFRSCPKLAELHLMLVENRKVEMGEELKNELRPGFQRLRLFEFDWDMNPRQIIQEILTWLKDCAQLTVWNRNRSGLVIDESLTLNPDLAHNLQLLHLWLVPVEFVKWILSFCPNIHTLKLQIIEEPKDLHNEIVRLKKLKDLHIGTSNGIDPKEVTSVALRTKTTLLTSSKLIRNCRQVEILRVESFCITLRDLAELEHYNNLKEADLHWLDGPSVKEALTILKRCANLRRLSLTRWTKLFFPPANEMCDFIMKLKHLTYLYIQYCDNRQCDHFKSVRDKVNEFVLHRRPNLKFYLSCCYNFANSS